MAEKPPNSATRDTTPGPDPGICPACGAEFEPSLAACPRCMQPLDSDTATIAPPPGAKTPAPEDALRSPTTADGQNEPPPLAGPGGEGRYDDLGEIDRGGMGAIHHIIDRDLTRPVAKKILRKDQLDRAARFVEEAKVTGQLEHPNIVPIHELGIDEESQIYFTMKLVKGKPLDIILEEIRDGKRDTVRNFPLSRQLEVFLKICEAVAYAHSRGVVHRDLKPDNVMVGEFGEVLVMDWGLAKVLGEEESHDAGAVSSVRYEPGFRGTIAGGIVGTPAFMSPEQARGKSEEVDETSDIWALGGILYTMLCFECPYEGPTLTVTIAKAGERDLLP
ncbi:MAG: serine/threonine-protein kinase, partial [Planctomycetota bacterium]